MIARLLAGLIVAGGVALPAAAQDTRKWADIDCAQSKIIAPAGLKCRATQVYHGAQGNAGTSAGGAFQRWSAYGTVGGSKFFYFVAEGSEPQSSVYTSFTLLDTITQAGGALTRGATELSELKQAAGGDYATFKRPPGEACFAMRKYGPSQGSRFKWLMYGGRCDPVANAASPAEIAKFIADAGFRD
jgi:hypothetical protein